jgi:co-chaperonin GroES (HSP10)
MVAKKAVQDISKFIVIGDRVLIKPKSQQERTSSGYPIPVISETDEPWKNKADDVRYVPLQAREGDLAVFLQKSAYEIEFNKEKYLIVPHSAILLLVRDEGLFE